MLERIQDIYKNHPTLLVDDKKLKINSDTIYKRIPYPGYIEYLAHPHSRGSGPGWIRIAYSHFDANVYAAIVKDEGSCVNFKDGVVFCNPPEIFELFGHKEIEVPEPTEFKIEFEVEVRELEEDPMGENPMGENPMEMYSEEDFRLISEFLNSKLPALRDFYYTSVKNHGINEQESRVAAWHYKAGYLAAINELKNV